MNMPLRKSRELLTIDPDQLAPIDRQRIEAISRRSQALLAAAAQDRPARRWYVIEVESGADNKVAERLMFGGVEVWVPVTFTKAKRRSGMKSAAPAIAHLVVPGYVFAKVEATYEAWSALTATTGASGIIASVAGRPLAVADDRVDLFKAYIADDKDAAATILKLVREGDLGMIRDGAMKGLEGRAVAVDDDRGVAILEIILFGRLTPVKADIANISKL
ncbi:MAG: hypothetical protein KL863_09030 [Rhizobium sp.]|nr:hypothetical protein [Rhizobium sp.]